MDKKDIERRLEAAEKQMIGLQDEIQNLKAKLDEVQDEPEIPDMPDFEMDEKFYYLDSATCDVEYSTTDNDIDAVDFNMFHTKEYADEFAQKCKLIAMMMHCKWYLDRDYVPDWWNSDENKFSLIFNHSKHKFDIDIWQTVDHNSVYFSTREKAEKCAEWLNTHWKEDGNGTD